MFKNLESQFDLIFGKGNPLLANPSGFDDLDDDSDYDELDEDDWEDEGSGNWDDSWDDGVEEEEEEEDCEGGYAWDDDACPDDEDHWEEDCDDWLEDDYDSDEDEGTQYQGSADQIFKAIEKANDSLDD